MTFRKAGVVFYMNLFLLDPDLDVCAALHVDRHMKQILECCQVLATAYPSGVARMKHTHFNHPVAVFIRKSLSNFNYAIQYGEALCREKRLRYKTPHKCELDLKWYKDNPPKIEDKGLTEFPRAFGEFKSVIRQSDSVFVDYKKYYLLAKRHLFFKKDGSHCWKNREIPSWVQNYLTTGEIDVS